jgi:uncharacterized protein (TIGR01777 family)
VDIAVSGASGLIGRALTASLVADGHRVIPLVRPSSGPAPQGAAGSRFTGDHIEWDPVARTIDAAALEGLDAVVHLAGAGVAARPWTKAHRRAVRDSRVDGTSLLAATLARLGAKPRVLVSGSAIGYYGSRGDLLLPEDAGPGDDFLARVCVAWEAATAPAAQAGIRVSTVRTGQVLAPHGGALGPQRPLFRVGLGARAGTGAQWVSWIHLEDEVDAIRHVLDRDDVAGPVNLVAPNPVRNADFAGAFAASFGRRARLTIPRWVTVAPGGVGPLVDSLLFASQRVVPRVLERTGFRFRYPRLSEALAQV